MLEEEEDVPAVFNSCISYLARPQALIEEGLFRVSGSKSEIIKFSDRFSSGEVINLPKECLEPATICGLLKEEIKNGCRPLGLEHAKEVGAAAAEGTDAVKVALQALSPANTALLCALMQLFEKIVMEPANKMQVPNLGTSIGPTLFPGLNSRQRDVAFGMLLENWRQMWDEATVQEAAALFVSPAISAAATAAATAAAAAFTVSRSSRHVHTVFQS
eukprot:gene19290-26837_t